MERLPKRKQNRLSGYDYSQNGCYFVTVCTKKRKPLFWDSSVDLNGTMPTVGIDSSFPASSCMPLLSEYGKIVETAIREIPNHYPNVEMERFVVMSDHVHMVMTIFGELPDERECLPHVSAPTIIGQMKRVVSQKIGFSVWQKSYHDHIIRNEIDYCSAVEYVENNPMYWFLRKEE